MWAGRYQNTGVKCAYVRLLMYKGYFAVKFIALNTTSIKAFMYSKGIKIY